MSQRRNVEIYFTEGCNQKLFRECFLPTLPSLSFLFHCFPPSIFHASKWPLFAPLSGRKWHLQHPNTFPGLQIHKNALAAEPQPRTHFQCRPRNVAGSCKKCPHRRRLRGWFGSRAFIGKIMWLLSSLRNSPHCCNFLHQNAWLLCADAIISWT